MKNIRIYKCLTCLMLVCGGLTLTATAAEETNKVAQLLERPDYWPWTVGIEGGTEGIGGLFGTWRFSDHVGVHLAADFTQWSVHHVSIADIHYDAKLRLLNEPLTLNIYPWKKHSFYVSFGWLFNQNRLTGSASDTGTIIIDGHPFPTDRVGSLDLKIRQQWVNPYLSIGGNFLYFDHAHHWALGGELGVAFTGDPQVSLTRSGPPDALIDAAVQRAQRRAQDYANQFKWWPVAKIQVSFAF